LNVIPTSNSRPLTTNVCEIEGKLGSPVVSTALISDKTRIFIPVFSAVLTAILIPNLKVESPGILFNREQIDMLALLNQRAKEEK
jgi:hypothetical protein